MLQRNKVFAPDTKVTYVPCAGLDEHDNNLVEYTPKMNYAETTLKQALLSNAVKHSYINKTNPVLLTLDTALQNGKISMTVFVMEGHLLKEDDVYVTPSNLVFTVVGIKLLDGTDVNEAVQSQTVVLQL